MARPIKSEVTIHWTGGFVSRHSLVRAVQSYEQLANYAQLRARIEELRSSRPDDGGGGPNA